MCVENLDVSGTIQSTLNILPHLILKTPQYLDVLTANLSSLSRVALLLRDSAKLWTRMCRKQTSTAESGGGWAGWMKV